MHIQPGSAVERWNDRVVATYIGFLRAINLGAKRKFPKAAIVAGVEAAGFTDVETYINTGNVRFDTTLRSRAKIEAALEAAFEAEAGFEVPTVVLHPGRAARDRRARRRRSGTTASTTCRCCKDVPTAAAVAALEGSITTDEVAKVGGRAVHLLLGENYHEATLTNASRREAPRSRDEPQPDRDQARWSRVVLTW